MNSEIPHRRVAICLFYTADGKLLLQERGKWSKSGEEWAFFGGGLDEGEIPCQAVVREINEELTYDLKLYMFYRAFDFSTPQKKYTFYVFLSPFDGDMSVFKQTEGCGMKLFRVDEVLKLNMFALDILILNDLKKEFFDKL